MIHDKTIIRLMSYSQLSSKCAVAIPLPSSMAAFAPLPEVSQLKRDSFFFLFGVLQMFADPGFII